MRNTSSLLVFFTIFIACSATIKTLSSSCFCDVSNSCDPYCCCDKECSSTLVYNWNNYTLCANDGYPIPLCSYYTEQTMHSHDLYQGLRLIYTIIKRLFCISKINFVDPAAGFMSSTSNEQISITSNTVSAISSNIINLASVANSSKLPFKNSLGTCGDYTLRDMNNIQDDSCRAYISSSVSSGTVLAHDYLSFPQFADNNNLVKSSLNVYFLKDPSTSSVNTSSASSSCSGNICQVIKQIKLTFIKNSTSTLIDYNSSYIVMGNTLISGPTYINIKYSYSFISKSSNYGYSSAKAYTKNSLLTFLKSSTNSTYYKIFNPVNLAIMDTDGNCRSASTDQSDQSNLISIKFGVNGVYTCKGQFTDFLKNILINAFDYVGKFGTSTTNLADFVSITSSSLVTDKNAKLTFNYVQIGTKENPQYQIIGAAYEPVDKQTNRFSLFIEFKAASNSLVLNLPSPPIIDAYLPNDFLYPFYVA